MFTIVGRRSLGFNLFYTPECPSHYEPKGFAHPGDDVIPFLEAEESEDVSTGATQFATTSHHLDIAVRHLDAREDDRPAGNASARIQERTDHCRQEQRFVPNKEGEQGNIGAAVSSVDDPSQLLPRQNTPPAIAPLSSQTKADLEIKQALQKMQRSSSRPSDLVPTQVLPQVLRSPNQREAGSSNSSSILRRAERNTAVVEEPKRYVLIPEKVAEIWLHVRKVEDKCAATESIFDKQALDLYCIKRNRRSDVVRCECEKRAMGKKMVCCKP